MGTVASLIFTGELHLEPEVTPGEP